MRKQVAPQNRDCPCPASPWCVGTKNSCCSRTAPSVCVRPFCHFVTLKGFYGSQLCFALLCESHYPESNVQWIFRQIASVLLCLATPLAFKVHVINSCVPAPVLFLWPLAGRDKLAGYCCWRHTIVRVRLRLKTTIYEFVINWLTNIVPRKETAVILFVLDLCFSSVTNP